jgi:hypothetical protein
MGKGVSAPASVVQPVIHVKYYRSKSFEMLSTTSRTNTSTKKHIYHRWDLYQDHTLYCVWARLSLTNSSYQQYTKRVPQTMIKFTTSAGLFLIF